MFRGKLDRTGRRHASGCRKSGQWRWGYHTTALRNVESILREGLIPYPLHKGLGFPERGVWLWLDRGRDDWDEIGVVLQRMLDHETFEVALLDVTWPQCSEWGGCLQEFSVKHEGHLTGNLGNVWQYHHDRPARIVVERIPPKEISVVRTYDLRAIL